MTARYRVNTWTCALSSLLTIVLDLRLLISSKQMRTLKDTFPPAERTAQNCKSQRDSSAQRKTGRRRPSGAAEATTRRVFSERHWERPPEADPPPAEK